MDRRCIICGEVPKTAFTYPQNMKEAFKWQSLLSIYVPAETLRHHCCICQKHVDPSVTQQSNQQQQETQGNRCQGGHMGRIHGDANDQRLSVSFNDSDAIHYFGQHNMDDEVGEYDGTYSKLNQRSMPHSLNSSTLQNKECGFDNCTSDTTIESEELFKEKKIFGTRYTSGHENSAAIFNDSSTYICGPSCSQREYQMTVNRSNLVNEKQQSNTRKSLGVQQTGQSQMTQRSNQSIMNQNSNQKCNSSTCRRKAGNNCNQIKQTVPRCNSCWGCSNKKMQQQWVQNAASARVKNGIPNLPSMDALSNTSLTNQCFCQMHLQNQQQSSQRSQKCQCSLPCAGIEQNMDFKTSSLADSGFSDINCDYSLCSNASCSPECPGATETVMPKTKPSNWPPVVTTSADKNLPVPVNVLIMGGSMLPTYCNTSSAKDEAPLVPEMCVLESDFTKERAVFPDIDEPKYTICRPSTHAEPSDNTKSMEEELSSTDVLLLGMAQSESCTCDANAASKCPAQKANMPMLADQQNVQAKDVNYQQFIQYQMIRIDELGGLLAQQEKLQQTILAKMNELQANTKVIDTKAVGTSAKPTSILSKKSNMKTMSEIPRSNAGTAANSGTNNSKSTPLYAMPGSTKPNRSNSSKRTTNLHNQMLLNPIMVSNQICLDSMNGGQNSIPYNVLNTAELQPKQICLNPLIRILPTIASYKAN